MDRLRHRAVGAGGERPLEPLALHAQREHDHLDVLVLLSQALDQRDRGFGVATFVYEHDLGAGLRDPCRGGLARVDIAEKLKCAAIAQSRANRPYDQWVVGYDDKSLHSALPLICPETRPAAPRPSRVGGGHTWSCLFPGSAADGPPSAASLGSQGCGHDASRAIGRTGARAFKSLNALGPCDKLPMARTQRIAVRCWMRSRAGCAAGSPCIGAAANDQGLRTLDESTPIGDGRPMKRLVVVAEDSLIVEAIGIALRKSGEFSLLGHLDARSASVEKIVEAGARTGVDRRDGSVRTRGRAHPADQGRAREHRGDRADAVAGVRPARRDLRSRRERGGLQGDQSGRAGDADPRDARRSRAPPPQAGRVRSRHRPARSTAAEESVLSARELEVLRLVAAGSTNGEIARKLWVTEQTVKFHLSNIYRKLEVGNRTEASHYAHVNGLLNGGERGRFLSRVPSPVAARRRRAPRQAVDDRWRRTCSGVRSSSRRSRPSDQPRT